MSAAEWLDRVDARMDHTGYHPEKDATVAMSAALRVVLDLHEKPAVILNDQELRIAYALTRKALESLGDDLT